MIDNTVDADDAVGSDGDAGHENTVRTDKGIFEDANGAKAIAPRGRTRDAVAKDTIRAIMGQQKDALRKSDAIADFDEPRFGAKVGRGSEDFTILADLDAEGAKVGDFVALAHDVIACREPCFFQEQVQAARPRMLIGGVPRRGGQRFGVRQS